ncbi:hypothetical protein IAU60_006484 [Kwoniella sp. DSM 27419]
MNKNTLALHPLSGYSFVERESQPEEDHSVGTRLKRLEDQYKESGIRRSVEAIMLVEVHGFPHVLVLQVANAFYKLPGGYLDPSETDSAGLVTRLNEQLGVPFSPRSAGMHDPPLHGRVVDGNDDPHGETNGQKIGHTNGHDKPLTDEVKVLSGGENLWINTSGKDWQVEDCLSVWWRPNFDTFFYPYIPAHISQPKECKKLYLVSLPQNKTFAVPVNMKLHAIPIYEFYDNAARYGPQFAGIPYILSRRV